jgi:hypothetical protein
MECAKCKKIAEIKVQNLDFCLSCLEKIIIKRIRKEVRESKFFEKNDSILIIDDGTKEAKVTIYLMKHLLGDMPVKIEIRKQKYSLGDKVKGRHTKVIIPWNADMEGVYFLDSIFSGKKSDLRGNFTLGKKTYIKLLMPVLSFEIEGLAKAKRLQYIIIKQKKQTSGALMLDKLETEYPEIKFSVLKSSGELRE